ncbi:MAG: hypothetical protein Q7S35_13820 [Candidatus Limnocylindrales bacterium]|nr:hypothetical protein [Candidatus Limnocylindrales bacterium]
MNNYSQEYIDACRAQIDDHVAAYRRVVTAGANLSGASGTEFDAAIRAFEPVFFNNLVQVLENSFMNRSRTIERKDGNPLNEVRVLCTSMLSNGGTMAADKTIRMDPAKSVLKYRVGDEIAVREEDFGLLAHGFFADLERKFLET